MDDAQAMEWIEADAAEMVQLLRDADADTTVPTCPEWTARDLGRHIAGGFAAWYPYNAATPRDQWTTDGLLAGFAPIGTDHLANVDRFEEGVARFLDGCAHADPERPTWAFGDTEPARWWIRRAGAELTVHLTDAAAMHGRSSSTSPEGHCEAIDEVTGSLYPKIAAVRQVMAGLTGQPIGAPPTIPTGAVALVAEDTGREWTLRSAGGRPVQAAGVADDVEAVGRGSSADVLAWLHGRPLAEPLDLEGDGQLLDSWKLFQGL